MINGFTLLEVMIVLTIIVGVLIPTYPIIDRQYQYHKLEQETEKLATYIEIKRKEAVLDKNHRDIRLYRSTYPHSYAHIRGVLILERHYLPKDYELYTNINNNLIRFSYAAYAIHYQPGGTIRITNGRGDYKEIIIHPFSGIIEIR